MTKRKTRASGLADPIHLNPRDAKKPDLIVVIIETPKGSRNKYAYDAKERVFELKKVLPAGMAFPYDFGFVPSTVGGDGDPLDVLVLMDEPAFAGCKLTCRVIGIIEGEQGEKGNTQRNDRIVAIEAANQSFAHVRHIDDLGSLFCKELEEFFVNFHKLSGKKFRVLGVKGPAAAQRAIKPSRVRQGLTSEKVFLIRLYARGRFACLPFLLTRRGCEVRSHAARRWGYKIEAAQSAKNPRHYARLGSARYHQPVHPAGRGSASAGIRKSLVRDQSTPLLCDGRLASTVATQIVNIKAFPEDCSDKNRNVGADINPIVQQDAVHRVPHRCRALPDKQPLGNTRRITGAPLGTDLAHQRGQQYHGAAPP